MTVHQHDQHSDLILCYFLPYIPNIMYYLFYPLPLQADLCRDPDQAWAAEQAAQAWFGRRFKNH